MLGLDHTRNIRSPSPTRRQQWNILRSPSYNLTMWVGRLLTTWNVANETPNCTRPTVARR